MIKGENHMQPDNSVAKRGRKLQTAAVLLAIALVGAFVWVTHSKSEQRQRLEKETTATATAAPVVEVVTAKKTSEASALSLPGETEAWYASTIYARVDGYVKSWAADIGDRVKKGQVLATIETPDLDAQLVAARAKLKSSQASVDFTKSTYERWKDSPNGVVSQQEREAKKADYDRAVAQEGLDQADVDRYTTLTAFKQVTAPYDGTITERHIDIGNLVTAGSTANTTPLYRMIQDNPLRVFADVPQGAASEVKAGTEAKITFNGSREAIEGKVTRTADAINQQTRTLRTEVDIPNPDHKLVSGMYVTLEFQIPAAGLVQIPAAALSLRSGGPQVAIVKDGKVTFTNVTIARDDGNVIEIGSGLNPDDKVALNISSEITDGEAVDAHDSGEGTTDAASHGK